MSSPSPADIKAHGSGIDTFAPVRLSDSMGVGFYIRHRTAPEKGYIKILVFLSVVLTFTRFGLQITSFMNFGPNSHGDPFRIKTQPWTTPARMVIDALCMLNIQMFFVIRIWAFSKILPLVLGLLTLVFACFALWIYLIYSVATSPILPFWTTLLIALSVVTAVTDITLSATFVILMWKSREATMHLYAHQEHHQHPLAGGMVISALATAAAIAVSVDPKSLVCMTLYQAVGVLYTNTFFALLNSREHLRAQCAQVTNIPTTALGRQSVMPTEIRLGTWHDPQARSINASGAETAVVQAAALSVRVS
ncbi:uncharacterized protein BXZ73DRAFT_106565 [Epithele typhae]|uniref:uncharacterized protein n=1 Tax=Epithele typhae TaxID=378194 RepID=UPI00200882EF|nr:uncharacterized protein BXZ73DRAFT_106565 [Epithele typhae]KAH9914492.1 hypothetical protein BXZ73DRAFT_106565 [Epithele typhae]